MACDEIMVHTYDAGTGLGESFRPDPRLTGRLLRRLSPGSVRVPTRAPTWALVRVPTRAPTWALVRVPTRAPVRGPDPWATLLWANGRVDLPGRPRQMSWRWHCAPLAEWNGQPPATAAPAL
jgi:hypothetical protein